MRIKSKCSLPSAYLGCLPPGFKDFGSARQFGDRMTWKPSYLLTLPRPQIHRLQTSQAWHILKLSSHRASQYDGNECKSVLEEEHHTAYRQPVVCHVETTTLGKLG